MFHFIVGDVHGKDITLGVQPAQVETVSVKRGIAWDYSNPEIVVAEYPIMGISGENIIVKVSWNGEESLRSIPMNEIKLKTTDSVLTPYVYRENYIYTEYDYSKNPPEALRKDSESWSNYFLCGSEKQIQSLFGYEEEFNFEQ